jgi:hypothetical protein
MPRPRSFIDGEGIRKARTLRRFEPIHEHLAIALAAGDTGAALRQTLPRQVERVEPAVH